MESVNFLADHLSAFRHSKEIKSNPKIHHMLKFPSSLH